jgi:single-stranded-DNA-specific exonuclease
VRRWLDPEEIRDDPLGTLQLPALIRRVLVRRGFNDPAAAQAFLNPYAVESTPFPGIDRAVERLRQAVHDHESICVWGDFDVDGQTSTSLLFQALQIMGAKVGYHVPVRAKEGHGVHLESLKDVLDRGARLVLTCDTGIEAHEAVAYAASRGVPVVITDHHELGERLPDAYAILNPKMLADDHPLANLSGAGVAYKLVEALLSSSQLESQPLLDLVALGLVADVAVLRGETRALAQKGIEALRNTGRLGLKVLAESAKINLSELTEETIGFGIAPRLNAVGRLSDANAAVELLLSSDAVRARVLAAQIEGLNTQRKLLTDQVYQAVEAQLNADSALLARPILILSHRSWPGGVVGIVASRLVDRYRKPAILLTAGDDGLLRGSARSIDGLDITRAISAARTSLVAFGGHPMAAGLALREEMLPQVRQTIEAEVERLLGASQIEEETLEIDQWVALGDLSAELADQIERLAPFGAGNRAPLFGARRLSLKSRRELGAMKEHRALLVADDAGRSQEVLWWNAAEEEWPEGKFDLAFTVRARSFRGERGIAAELMDYRLVEAKPLEVKAPAVALVDLRLQGTSAKLPATCFIWAEGQDAARGYDRFHLRISEELGVWTSPPAHAELRRAVAAVQPRRVYLVGVPPPGAETAEDFLSRLAGLAKFVLNRHDGRTTISDLAAACAHRELTVRIGLEWLAAGGHLKTESSQDELRLTRSHSAPNPGLQRELYAGVRSLIDETAAYRKYFATAEAKALLEVDM